MNILSIVLISIGALLIGVGIASWYWRVGLLERIKGWRTLIWNGIVSFMPIILYVLDRLQAIDWYSVMTPTNAIIFGIAIGGIGVWLRMITTGPVGSKGEDEPLPETKAGD